MSTEPIYIECEGSQCPTHARSNGFGTCQMCGKEVPTDAADGWAVKHQRLHVLAMYGRRAAEVRDNQQGGQTSR